MVAPKVHLIKRQATVRGSTVTITACGQWDATRVTRQVGDVTCSRCQRTILMADKEVKARGRRRRK